MKKLLISFGCLFLFFVSCKKDKDEVKDPSRSELIVGPGPLLLLEQMQMAIIFSRNLKKRLLAKEPPLCKPNIQTGLVKLSLKDLKHQLKQQKQPGN